MTERETKVRGDWMKDGESYPAKVGDERWNGWLIPWFDHDICELIIADQAVLRANAGDQGGDWELVVWEKGRQVVLILDGYNGTEIDRCEPRKDGRISIGGYLWTWYEAEMPACPWQCGYKGNPVPNTDPVRKDDPRWHERNPYKCPRCGEVGGGERLGHLGSQRDPI